jgi:hypothetical protein
MELTCPRCQAVVDERFYGPCGECRATLRAEVRGEARTMDEARFEPAMHVTANAVAQKE